MDNGTGSEINSRALSDTQKNIRKDSDNRPRVFIPDLFARCKWPWARRINPHCDEVENESNAWLASFQTLDPKLRDHIYLSKLALAVSLALPDARKEDLRSACDFYVLTGVMDEESDTATPAEVRKQSEITLDAFQNPHVPRPDGEWIGGEMSRQFWEINMQYTAKDWQKRVTELMDEFLEGAVQQSIDRNQQKILGITDYIKERRRTIAAKYLFFIAGLGLDIPEEVMSHPAIQDMILAGVDMIFIGNDVASYNVEQMLGDDLHNIITCIMKEHHTDVNGAILWIEDHFCGVAERFLSAMASLPEWKEPLNSQVKVYCNRLGQVPVGVYCWYFETRKYFGKGGPEIKKGKWLSLLPKSSSGKKVGPAESLDNFLF